jgi:CBS domain-containing protein
MEIREIMTPHPEGISSDGTIRDASHHMRDLNVGILPVIEGDSLIGVLTDRDIVVRVIAENRDPAQTRVEEIMSREVFTCAEDTDLEEAVQIMEDNQVRRLLVTDSKGRCVGIVSLGDIAMTSDTELKAEVIAAVSEPSRPRR